MNSLPRSLADPWRYTRTPYRSRVSYVRPTQVRARVRAHMQPQAIPITHKVGVFTRRSWGLSPFEVVVGLVAGAFLLLGPWPVVR